MTPAEALKVLEARHPVRRRVVVDFETFYSKDYTLRGNTPDRYVRDPRFQVIGVAVKDGEAPSVWMEHAEFAIWALRQDWSEIAVIAHNAPFDCFILAEKYGVRPSFFVDTLSMARPLYGAEVGGSLDKLSMHLGLGVKGKEVNAAKGKRREDFTREEWEAYGRYSCNDADLALALFKHLAPQLPEAELWHIDQTVRYFVEPLLVLDQPLLVDFHAEEVQRKADLLAQSETSKDVFMSNDKFAALLRSRGVEPPTKISPRTKLLAYAFAKSDVGMQELLEHQDDEIRLLAEIRVGVKSTINETRTQRLIQVGTNALSILLKWCGAHTFRWSGAGAMNLQNLPRVQGKCIHPKGHEGKHAVR